MKPTKEEALKCVRLILEYLGEDVNREGLKDTPARVLRSWEKLFGGYNIDPKEVAKTAFGTDGYDQMVVLRDIEFYSTCEHHMSYVRSPKVSQAVDGKLRPRSGLCCLMFVRYVRWLNDTHQWAIL